jgi:hypothetical protein
VIIIISELYRRRKNGAKTLDRVTNRQKVASVGKGYWKRISSKQSARQQHLSRLKACAFLSLKKIVVKKCNILYLGLVNAI